MRRPSNSTRPPDMPPGGSSRPMIAAPVSDLPAPDSPTTPRTSPSAMSKLRPSTAVTTPRRVAKAMLRSSTCSSFRAAPRSLTPSGSMAARGGALDAEPGIDGVVEEIDDEVDDDEEERDQHQIRGHDRDVGE